MNDIYAAYKRWCLRVAGQANCSPAGIGVAILVVAGIAWLARYGRQIAEALRVGAAVVLCVAAVALVAAVARMVTQQSRGRTATSQPEPEPEAAALAPQPEPAPGPPARLDQVLPAAHPDRIPALGETVQLDGDRVIRLTDDGALQVERVTS